MANWTLDNEYLTFDDVSLVPQFSDIESRHKINLYHSKNLSLAVPFISANMRTVTGVEMIKALDDIGGFGILHRFFNSINDLEKALIELNEAPYRFGVSIGVNEDSYPLLELYDKYHVIYLCIDIAHGYHDKTFKMIEYIKSKYENKFKIIAGNVATGEAATQLVDAGADIVKVGIGGGSHCTTRVVTGHGVPQLSAIRQVAEAREIYSKSGHSFGIIADGGIRNSGDIAKSIAAGADFVMLGKLLAGCEESPAELKRTVNGLEKIYRGSASFEAQKLRRDNIIAEGVQSSIPYTGPVKAIIYQLANGLKSALSYSGAHNLIEFQQKAQFIKITHNSYIEGTPHGANT